MRRFQDGVGSAALAAGPALRIGLKTRSGGVEYVWGQLVGWPTPASLECVLSSVPCDCAGYTAGQSCALPLEDAADYCVASKRDGVV